MMKRYLLILAMMFAATFATYAQTGRSVSGTVIDSTKLSVPGASVKLTSAEGDSVVAAADMNGKFSFPSVKGTKLNVTVTSIGYQVLLKHYSLEAGTEPVSLGDIMLQLQSNELKQVNITGAPNPVTLKEDTVEYKISTYKVRDNAPVEDAIRKMPGVDVDKDGNVTAQGKSVTKVRVNGKDFFAGDLKTATQNLPADIVESVQVIDDYGDQANLTGVKTGEPTKILNINIRKDKNYGYSLQATGGEGTDALPSSEANNANRYLGTVNFFKFKGDQQIAVLGNLNNTNLNTFSFSGATGGGFGGNFNGGGRGGGGGRGNALRGGGSTTTNANGITDAKSLGLNFRDQWGKNVSVYGSYSFNDNSTFTNSNSLQINRFQNPSTSTSTSQETNNPLNHRFNFNVEWKPDTVNYFKFTPSFSYSRTNTVGYESVAYTLADSSRASANQSYNVNSLTNTTSPNFGINALYNHKFGRRGRNLSLNLSWNTAKNEQYDNPIYNYTLGTPTTPLNQRINTNSRTTTWGANFAYMEPLSNVSFLELNYAYNHSLTSSDKMTDTLSYAGTTPPTEYNDGDFNRYALLSNSYDYTFTTNRIGLNYRLVENKYNLTAGFGVQPASLKGNSVNAPETVKNTFNFIPTARFVYNFSRSKSFNFNYNGQSSQPSFNQLQPVLDLSNALYPVLGNPDLKPSFTNTIEARYNNFSFETGNVFFTRFSYTTIADNVVSQTTTYSRFSEATLAADPSLKNLQNTNLTTYRNADGYYQFSGFGVFSKPFAERKYTLFLNGNVSYSNNIGYSNTVDSLNRASEFEKNISKNLVFTPGVRFRVNIDDIMDAEVNSSYAINRTVSAIGNNPLLNTNARTLNLGVNGKNYLWKDWTLSYDFTRSVNYGYNVAVTNPNILNVYVERRFLKDNMATIRLSGLDLFNQNRGFTSNDNGTITTQSNVNRLSRYVMLTFSLRLRKFAGGSPSQGGDRNFRRGEGGGPGAGGPPPGGGPM